MYVSTAQSQAQPTELKKCSLWLSQNADALITIAVVLACETRLGLEALLIEPNADVINR
jgi:hypothetical protein